MTDCKKIQWRRRWTFWKRTMDRNSEKEKGWKSLMRRKCWAKPRPLLTLRFWRFRVETSDTHVLISFEHMRPETIDFIKRKLTVGHHSFNLCLIKYDSCFFSPPHTIICFSHFDIFCCFFSLSFCIYLSFNLLSEHSALLVSGRVHVTWVRYVSFRPRRGEKHGITLRVLRVVKVCQCSLAVAIVEFNSCMKHLTAKWILRFVSYMDIKYFIGSMFRNQNNW